jgi:cytochrome P450
LSSPPRWIESERIWAITRYRDAAFLLKSDDVVLVDVVGRLSRISDRLGGAFPNLLLLLGTSHPFQNGAAHDAARAALKEMMGAMLRRWTDDAIGASASELLAPFADGAPFDAAKEIATALPAGILAGMLGIDAVEIETLGELSRTISTIWHRDTLPLKELRAMEVAAERAVALLRETLGSGRSAEFARVAFLTMAGVDATAGLLGSAIHLLSLRPDLQQRLRTDPSLIPDAAGETLRMWPPLRRIVGRTTLREIVLPDAVLPRGAILVIDLERAHRDGDVFAEPERFDLGRRGPPPLAFGFGAHACVGAALARLEAKVLIERLVRDYVVRPAGEAVRGTSADWHEFLRLPIRLAAS